MKKNNKIKCLSTKTVQKGQYIKPIKPKNTIVYNNIYTPISY